MSFPRYSGYKDSGVEWLGAVPKHWEVAPIKRLFAVLDGRRVPLSGEERADRQGEFPYYGASGIIDCIDAWIFDEDLILVSEDGANLLNRSTPIAFVAKGKYWVNNHAHILKPRDAALIYWSERIESIDLTPFITGSAQPKLTINALVNLMVSAPPSAAERHQIQDFIIRESEKIDALVEEQRRLIELLKEKRQAIISHAVTKGLNPSTPMRSSGVNWMGDIPANWDVVMSRRLFRVRNEAARNSDQQLTASQKYGMVFQTDFVEMEGRRVVEVIQGTDSLRHAEPNDFVISLRSFQGGLEWCKFAGSVTFHYVVLAPIKDVHEPFFAYLFKSAAYIQALRATANLIRDGQDLRYSHFVLVDLPRVPFVEQVQIASYLDCETARIDALISESQLAIEFLRERRSALISAAVTGKIDVRQAAMSEVVA